MPVPSRSEVAESSTWNLGPLYRDVDQWEKDFSRLEQEAEQLIQFKGTLAQSSANIEQAFRCYLDVSRLMEKIYVYAHLSSDVDTSNSESLGNLQRTERLRAHIGALASYLIPELLEIDSKKLEKFLDQPELADLRRLLRDIVRHRPHTLSAKEENLLALGSELYGTSSRIYSQLNNADLTFPDVEIDGKPTPLTHGSYIVFLKNTDRSVRQKAFEHYYAVFDQHKNTIAAALTSSIKKDLYLARVRKFESSLERSLFADHITTEVYSNLIDTVSTHLSPLHRYYELRRHWLGLDKLRIYDTYTPLLGSIDISHSFEEATEVILESLSLLGDSYVSLLHEGLTTNRWVDRFENKGKRSGAYSSGCYDSPPYILLNFKEDDISSVFTLAHEAGHSMHSYLSNHNQPYQDHEYTIFVAEVASTFNEQLLIKRLKEKYSHDQTMLAFLINQQIDDIKATFYRQVMFAEFERIVHARAEENKPLTVDVYRDVYRELLKKYFGPAVQLTDLDDLECLRIPHFYSAFYVYKYATGLAAAVSLSQRVISQEADYPERYLVFLRSGCSKYPLELLRDTGVDLSSPEPIEETLRLFTSLLDELEAIQPPK